jgi:hypothetical protein
MLDMVRVTRRKTNPRLSYRLLVTMYDMRNRVHPMILEYLREWFSDALFQTLIQVDTKLRESPAFGKPITQHAPETRAAHQYLAVASELSDYLKLKKKEGPQSMPAAADIVETLKPQRSRENDGSDSASAPGRKPSEEELRMRDLVLGGDGR